MCTGVQKPISTRSCHSKHQLQKQPKTAYDMYSEIIEESSFIITLISKTYISKAKKLLDHLQISFHLQKRIHKCTGCECLWLYEIQCTNIHYKASSSCQPDRKRHLDTYDINVECFEKYFRTTGSFTLVVIYFPY